MLLCSRTKLSTASAQRRWPFSLILSFSEHLWACVTVFGDSIKTEPRRWPHRPEAVNLCDHPPTPTPAALWMGWNVLSLGRSSNSNIFLTPWLPNASKHTHTRACAGIKQKMFELFRRNFKSGYKCHPDVGLWHFSVSPHLINDCTISILTGCTGPEP